MHFIKTSQSFNSHLRVCYILSFQFEPNSEELDIIAFLLNETNPFFADQLFPPQTTPPTTTEPPIATKPPKYLGKRETSHNVSGQRINFTSKSLCLNYLTFD